MADATSPIDDAADSGGTLVSWEEGIGDDKKYHVANVSAEGVTLVRKMKDYKAWVELVAAADGSPGEAAELLRQQPKAVQLAPGDLAKVTYSDKLSQLALFDASGQKIKVPEGKEQGDLFAAIKHHLGGKESEEEADAWAVMQTPLFVLAVIAVIGGFCIWFTAISDPNYVATGRRAGMANLLNWVGYSIGPVWMSVIVGTLAALVLAGMIHNLVKRPIRQVLEYPG